MFAITRIGLTVVAAVLLAMSPGTSNAKGIRCDTTYGVTFPLEKVTGEKWKDRTNKRSFIPDGFGNHLCIFDDREQDIRISIWVHPPQAISSYRHVTKNERRLVAYLAIGKPNLKKVKREVRPSSAMNGLISVQQTFIVFDLDGRPDTLQTEPIAIGDFVYQGQGFSVNVYAIYSQRYRDKPVALYRQREETVKEILREVLAGISFETLPRVKVPLPRELEVRSSSSNGVSAQKTAYLGAWLGNWSWGAEHVLVVTSVSESSAEIVYAVGESSHNEEAAVMTKGAFKGNSLVVAFRRRNIEISYTLNLERDTLKVIHSSLGGDREATLRRVDLKLLLQASHSPDGVVQAR